MKPSGNSLQRDATCYSLWLDVRIMVESVKVMLTRRGI